MKVNRKNLSRLVLPTIAGVLAFTVIGILIYRTWFTDQVVASNESGSSLEQTDLRPAPLEGSDVAVDTETSGNGFEQGTPIVGKKYRRNGHSLACFEKGKIEKLAVLFQRENFEEAKRRAMNMPKEGCVDIAGLEYKVLELTSTTLVMDAARSPTRRTVTLYVARIEMISSPDEPRYIGVSLPVE